MAHALVLVTLNLSATIDQHKAGTLAYQNLFNNASRLPAGPLYVVVMVYGPPNFFGAHPEFAYVFRRDTSSNGWKARPVSEPELDAIHMRSWTEDLGRAWILLGALPGSLTISRAVALRAACGGSQPPIGAGQSLANG